FFSLIRPPPRSPLFPYTTLFRSRDVDLHLEHLDPVAECLLEGTSGAHLDHARQRPVERLEQRRRAQPGPEVRAVQALARPGQQRSEEHTSELQSRSDLVCRPLLE